MLTNYNDTGGERKMAGKFGSFIVVGSSGLQPQIRA